MENKRLKENLPLVDRNSSQQVTNSLNKASRALHPTFVPQLFDCGSDPSKRALDHGGC